MGHFFKDHWFGAFISSVLASLVAAYLFEYVSLPAVVGYISPIFPSHQEQPRPSIDTMNLRGTTWKFQGKNDISQISFLQNDTVYISDSFYGKEGTWSQVGGIHIHFETGLFECDGTMDNNRYMSIVATCKERLNLALRAGHFPVSHNLLLSKER